MSLRPYQPNVEMWKRYFAGASAQTTNPVATVARAASLLKRQSNIKGGAQKKSVSRKKNSKQSTSKVAPRKTKRSTNKKNTATAKKPRKNPTKKTTKSKNKKQPKVRKIVCCDTLS